MAKAELEALYRNLMDTGFNFILAEEVELREIYNIVKDRYPELCDDTYLCSMNCKTRDKQPEWNHTVRAVLKKMRERGIATPGTSRGAWRFHGLARRARQPRPTHQPASYFAKLCWNTERWLCPTGDAPKVETPGTYVSRMGFGHEEWLFNFNWLLEGWKYSFLEPVNKSLAHLEGKIINVRLFTVGGRRGWFYVGQISACEVLTREQAADALKAFRVRGWLRQMEDHVRAVGGDVQGLRSSDPRLVFNIRFRRTSADLYDPPVTVAGTDAIRKIKRYSLVSTENAPAVDKQWSTRVAATKARPTGKIPRKGVAPGFIDLVHNEMQNELVARLKAKFGSEAIIVEEGYVDIKLKDKPRLLFIEIKPDSRPLHAIREALGQLLFYEFHSAAEGEPPTELVVAGPGELTQRDMDFLQHLQERWSLPIRYYCTCPAHGELEI
ncbi:MAG: hypothetical protein L0Y72_12620 [Gemmataceae bacterium]|nr:hypothetical protein [Gemmataceae bacterium]MCI0739882.1 hypothetical protein [Gemmataceae bacterium]